MKIVIFANNDIHCFNLLKKLENYLRKYQIKIILSKQVGDIKNLDSRLLELRAFEQKNSLEKLREIAKNLFATIEFSSGINQENFLQEMRNFEPDFFISIRFGEIFKEEIIKIPHLGIFNLHSGILPKYRGVLATFWTILNGNKKIGATLHYITDPRIDCGAIIAKSLIDVDFSGSLFGNIKNLYEASCGLIIEILDKIERGQEISSAPQDEKEESNYFSYPKTLEVERFLEIMPLLCHASIVPA